MGRPDLTERPLVSVRLNGALAEGTVESASHHPSYCDA